MSHIAQDKKKTIARLNRLIGQLEGIRRLVEAAKVGDNRTCYRVMQQLAAAAGAMQGLMARLVEEHLQHHVVDPEPRRQREKGKMELLKVWRSFHP